MKTLAIIFISVSTGLILGFIAAIKLFAFDVDLLGAPYAQQAFKLDQPVVLKQNNLLLEVPKGSVLRHRHSPKGVHFYSIDIIADYGQVFHQNTVKNIEYFYLPDDS